jgi:hypothetical protein
VSSAAINLCVASRRVFTVISVYFVIDSIRKLLDTPSYVPVCTLTAMTVLPTWITWVEYCFCDVSRSSPPYLITSSQGDKTVHCKWNYAKVTRTSDSMSLKVKVCNVELRFVRVSTATVMWSYPEGFHCDHID